MNEYIIMLAIVVFYVSFFTIFLSIFHILYYQKQKYADQQINLHAKKAELHYILGKISHSIFEKNNDKLKNIFFLLAEHVCDIKTEEQYWHCAYDIKCFIEELPNYYDITFPIEMQNKLNYFIIKLES